MDHFFFILSSVDGHFGSFLVLAVVNRAAMNILVHVTPFWKINLKCIKDLNVRPDAIKLRGKHKQNTLRHKLEQYLFHPPPRVMKIKTKISKWDLIKLKSGCTAKETINKTKRQPTEWEKIFANDVTNKGLISKIYKHLMQLNSKKTNNPIKNGQKT